jgi:hypothetical protein
MHGGRENPIALLVERNLAVDEGPDLLIFRLPGAV